MNEKEKYMEGTTWADERKQILTIRTDLEEFIPLNCGDTFEIKIDGCWGAARIEKSDTWYIEADIQPKDPEEMPLKGSLWDLSNYRARIIR